MTARIVGVVLACVALAGCASPRVSYAEAQHHYARADFYQAWMAIREARSKFPEDRQIEEAYERIRLAWLLEQGRRAVFGNRELDAIELFERVLVLEPDYEVAQRWIEKALRKLSNRAARRGDALQAAGDLEAALLAYKESLDYGPDNQIAQDGLRRLAATWERRRTDARGHYLDGVRALAEQLFQQTRYHMLIALDQDPTMEEARRPARRARDRLLEDRYRSARAMEAEGFFRAALMEYEALERLTDADHPLPDLGERIARVEREVEAGELIARGEMEGLRGNFAEARELLDRAQSLTTARTLDVADTRLMVNERELMKRYTQARDLEFQGQLRDALEAFRDIDERMSGFRDVRARISELEIRIEEADKAWQAGQEAEAAGDAEAALGHYRDVQIYWPDYEGAEAKVRELENEVPAPGDGDSGDGDSGDGDSGDGDSGDGDSGDGDSGDGDSGDGDSGDGAAGEAGTGAAGGGPDDGR